MSRETLADNFIEEMRPTTPCFPLRSSFVPKHNKDRAKAREINAALPVHEFCIGMPVQMIENFSKDRDRHIYNKMTGKIVGAAWSPELLRSEAATLDSAGLGGLADPEFVLVCFDEYNGESALPTTKSLGEKVVLIERHKTRLKDAKEGFAVKIGVKTASMTAEEKAKILTRE